MNIPKIMHFTWFQGFEDCTYPKEFDKNINAWQQMNPDYEIIRWDEETLSKLIRDKYPFYYNCWKNLSMCIKKCDMGRLILMLEYGGLYIDCDMMPLRSINSFLGDKEIYYRKLFLQKDQFYPEYYEYYEAESYAEPVNYDKYDILLSIENFRHQGEPAPITNALMISKNNESSKKFWQDLIEYMVPYKEGKVLMSFGTHRFGFYFQEHYKTQDFSNVLFLPAYYWLWMDDAYAKRLDPKFVLASHGFSGMWCDKTKVGGNGWNI